MMRLSNVLQVLVGFQLISSIKGHQKLLTVTEENAKSFLYARLKKRDLTHECSEWKGCSMEELSEVYNSKEERCEFLEWYHVGRNGACRRSGPHKDYELFGRGYYVKRFSGSCIKKYDISAQCLDINECTRGTHRCSRPGGVCTNTPGSYTCSCANYPGSGYSGNGYSCKPKCFGSTNCPNGGNCVRPDYCRNCRSGYYSPRCKRCPLQRIPNCRYMTCSEGPSNLRCTKCHYHGTAYSLVNNRCAPKCSWMTNRWCWPGTCGSDGLTSSCKCSTGFSRVAGTSKCEFLTSQPDLHSCFTRAVSQHNEYADSTTPPGMSNECGNQQDFYSKFQPTHTTYTLTFEFKVHVDNAAKPNYIHAYHFGVTGASVQVLTFTEEGSPVHKGVRRQLDRNHCTHAFSGSTMQTSSVTCKDRVLFEGPYLQNGYKYCVDYQVEGGGYLLTKNLETGSVNSTRKYFKSTRTNKTVCMTYDNAAPRHCSESHSCAPGSSYPIDVIPRITKNPVITVTFGGWLDSIPTSGNHELASGIDHLEFTIYTVVEKTRYVNQVGGKTGISHKANRTQGSWQVTLPSQGLYAVYVDVVDKVGNVKHARRFVLFDPDSTVEISQSHEIVVSTADPNTNFTWQTTHGPLTVNWTRRFHNTFHVHSNMLKQIASKSSMVGIYDQGTGVLPVTGTNNVDGIVEFKYSIVLIPDSINNLVSLPSPLQTVITHDTGNAMQDGDSYEIMIQAKDIMGNTKNDTVLLKVDSTPPMISSVGVTNNGLRELFVHFETDLSTMRFVFKAMDAHSGLHDVKWKLGTSRDAADISEGSLPVKSASDNRENTYCPTVAGGKCEYFNYSIDLNHLVEARKHKGNHNREYFITLIARNKALLASAPYSVKILIDASPPTTGVARDGKLDSQQDVNYQSDMTLSGIWDGFYDHESGVSYYKYAFAELCLSKQELVLVGKNSTVSHGTGVAKKDGKYYLSVVAYNGANEPSEPACSDGVQVDSVLPKFRDIYLNGLRVHEGIICISEREIWFVFRNFTRMRLSPVTACRMKCSDKVQVDINLIPVIPSPTNGSAMDSETSEDMCKLSSLYNESLPKFITTDHIHLHWKTSNSSPIHDYRIGVSNDLSGMKSTRGANFFTEIFSGLDEGNEISVQMIAISESGLHSQLSFGPILVDETPPRMVGTLQVDMGFKHDDPIVVSWADGSFYDEEYSDGIGEYQISIGSDEHNQAVAHFKAFTPKTICCQGGVGLEIEKRTLQDADDGFGNTYTVALKVFNKAGLYSVFKAPPFQISSALRPTAGVVYDIGPDPVIGTLNDVDYLEGNRFCVAWAGFHTHNDPIHYFVGLGTSDNCTDIMDFTPIHNATIFGDNFACFFLPKMPDFTKTYATVMASLDQAQSLPVTVSSDGAMVFTGSITQMSVAVFDGIGCDESRVLESLNGFSIHPKSKFSFKFSGIVPFFGSYFTIKLSSYGDLSNLTVTQNGETAKTMHFYSDNSTHRLLFTFEWKNQEYVFDAVNHAKTTLEVISVELMVCQIDLDYQSDTTMISGYWNFPRDIKKYVTHYESKVSIEACSPSCISVGDLLPWKVQREHRCTFHDLTLAPGNRYRLHVRPCFHHMCMSPSISNGVIVTPSIPTSGDIFTNVYLSGTSGNYTAEVSIRWQSFRVDHGITNEEVIRYHWTLSPTYRMKDVGNYWIAVYNSTQDTAKFHWNHHRLQRMYVLLRGHSLSNVYAVAVKKIGFESATTTALDKAVHDLSYEDIKRFAGVAHASSVQTKTLKDLHRSELDFTNITDSATALLTGKLFSEYTWSVATIPDPFINCSSNPSCIAFLKNSKNNVLIPNIKLLHGVKYFICVHAQFPRKPVFDGVEDTTEEHVCSNGFIVDTNSPIPGEVIVTNAVNGFLTTNAYITINWNSFVDLEESLPSLTTGVRSYWYSLGTSPGVDNVVPLTRREQETHVMLNNLILVDGQEYFVNVQAEDYVGHVTLASSNPFIVDTTPPSKGVVHVGSPHRTRGHVNRDMLQFHWQDFEDAQSGIKRYEFAIGSSPGLYDIFHLKEFTTTYVEVTDSTMLDGHNYYAIVMAINGAGLITSSDAKFVYDSSPPSSGLVRDCKNLTSLADYDFQTSTSTICVSWDGFHDPHSPITEYHVGVAEEKDEPMLSNVGLVTSLFMQSTLKTGRRYVATVEACNSVGLCRRASSDGIIIDPTPPLSGIVTVGHLQFGARHYQASRKYFSATWMGFQDPQSGIGRYEWCIGTSVGQCDVQAFRDCHHSNVQVRVDMDLPLATPIFATVRAFNKAGLATTKSSAPIQVDNTPPSVATVPVFRKRGMISLFEGNQFETNALHMAWKFHDPESGLAKHVVNVFSHHNGFNPVSNLEIGNENSLSVSLSKNHSLSDGDRYYVSVTACNYAGLCTVANSTGGVLVDSSPPHLGGFDSLKWTEEAGRTTLNLTWSGFVDPHSGIKQYILTVGSSYSSQELSNGFVTASHNLSSKYQQTTITLSKRTTPGHEFFISIVAENNVGLRSSILKHRVAVVRTASQNHSSGLLVVEKHSCDASFCNKDCACAPFGKKCETLPYSACKNSTKSDVTVHVTIGITSPLNISSNQKCLSAYWVSSSDVLRYEYSLGKANSRTVGSGVFGPDQVVWRNIDLWTNTTFCLPRTKYFQGNQKYVFYIRAWYANDAYSEFRSNEISVDITPPNQNRGRHIIDCLDEGSCSRDIDFSSNMNELSAKWDRLFRDVTGDIESYEVMMGTFPGDDSIMPKMRTTRTSFSATALKLKRGEKYFTTVKAINKVGLYTISTSDGVVIDNEPATCGIVFNTNQFSSKYSSSNTSCIGASWNGFDDLHSHIRRYIVSVGTHRNRHIVLKPQYVGIQNTVELCHLNLNHNMAYNVHVKAEDAAGHVSEDVQSDSLLIDTTPPEGFKCEAWSEDSAHITSINKADKMKTSKYRLILDAHETYELIFTSNKTNVQAFMLFLDSRKELYFTERSVASFRFYVENTAVYELVLSIEGDTTSISISLRKCTKESKDSSSVSLRQLSPFIVELTLEIKDRGSGIHKHLVGIGTTSGGFQVVALHNIGRQQHVTYDVFLPHGSPLYATVISENNAGVRSYFQSEKTVLDHSPPAISNITIEVVPSRVNNTVSILTSWAAQDSESNIKECTVELGYTSNTGNIKSRIPVVSTSPNCYTATATPSLAHGQSVYATILCSNNAELSTTSVIGPRTVVSNSPATSTATVNFLLPRTGMYERHEVALTDPSLVYVIWSGFHDFDNKLSYEIRLLKNNELFVDWRDTGHETNARFANLTVNNGDCLTAEVLAVNSGGFSSDLVRGKLCVDKRAPRVTGIKPDMRKIDDTVVINWKNCFDQEVTLWYEVCLGLSQGACDLLQTTETKESSISLKSRDIVANISREIFGVVTAVKPSGVYYKMSFSVVI